MPRNFPDHASVIHIAKLRGYREPIPNEMEEDYRKFVADSIQNDPKYPDPIEAHEVRTGKGWDQWSPDNQSDLFQHIFRKPNG